MKGNPSVSGGIKDLKLFKATQSGFEGKILILKLDDTLPRYCYVNVFVIVDKVLFEIASPLCRVPRTVPFVAKFT